MFKASSLLLVTLVLNVQLYSSAPIPGEFVQSSVVAEKPEEGGGEVVHYPEESIQKILIPVVAGESAQTSAEKLTSEDWTAKQDIPTIEIDPESVFIEGQVTVDIDEVVSQESALQEPLAVTPQASSEEETAPVKPAIAEASPGETTVDVALAVAVERESTEQHDLEDPPSAATNPIIPSEASEEEISEENAQAEEAVAVESTTEEASPRGHLLVVPNENAEVEPSASQKPLLDAEEKSVVLDPAEVETEEAGEAEPDAEEIVPEQLGPEEFDVILDPEGPAQHEPDPEEQQKTVPIISSEAKQGEDVEEHTEEVEAAVLEVVEEKVEEPLLSTKEEEESVVLSPVELETEGEGQVETAAEETVPQESAPGDQVVIVPVETAEGEPDLKEQEEPDPIISSEAKQEEDVEEHTEEVEAAVLEVVEEKAEEPLLSTKEEEESVVLSPVELETEGEGQVETAAEETVPQESAPGDQVDIVPVETAEGEPDLKEQEETISLEANQEEEDVEEHAEEVEAAVPEILEGNAEEEPVINKDLPPEEEESVLLSPEEIETEESEQEETAGEKTVPKESASEDPIVIVPVEGESDLKEQEKTVSIISSEEKQEKDVEKHVEEADAAVQVVLEGNAEEDTATNKDLPPEEEESVVLSPAEFETENEDQEEPAGVETVPQESAPEYPIVIAPVEGELDLEVEESIPIVSPEAPDEHAKVEVAVIVESEEMPVSIVPEENAEEEPAIDGEPLHSTPEEDEESVVPVSPELDSEEEGQEQTEPQQSAPEETVVVLVEPTNEEPAPDDPIIVFPLEDSEEDGPEDNTEEGVETAVQLDPLSHESALEEDTAPQEIEPDGSDPVMLTMSPVTDSLSESETIKEVLDPTGGGTVVATEASVVADAEVEIVLTAVDNGGDTIIKKLKKNFKAAILLIKEKPVAKVRRGTVLGAAFFTLMSFIVIGYVLTTVSKKLR